jgi:F-type H+-transporting ATPase subunit a
LKTRILFGFLFFLLINGSTISLFGQEVKREGETTEKFDANTFILDHVADSHEWHILTKQNGENIALYLPIIVYTKNKGFNVFSSKKLAYGKVYKGFKIEEKGDLKGTIVAVNEEGVADEKNLPLDLSMTKTVVAMLSAAVIGLLLFLSLARSYKKTGISHPKGMQSFFEPVILFIRDDIAIPNLGHKFEKYMPYLLTIFFFILINNIMGLIPTPPPFGGIVTGNIAITFILAICTFIVIQFSGNKMYWKHVFATPGVPFWLLPIMIPVEIIGLFTKPFALMIRLFANMVAGHFVSLSLISLIFIFGSLLLAPVSMLFVIFMDCLEVLVAFLQAYIFTLLSALFIGMAIQEEH